MCSEPQALLFLLNSWCLVSTTLIEPLLFYLLVVDVHVIQCSWLGYYRIQLSQLFSSTVCVFLLFLGLGVFIENISSHFHSKVYPSGWSLSLYWFTHWSWVFDACWGVLHNVPVESDSKGVGTNIMREALAFLWCSGCVSVFSVLFCHHRELNAHHEGKIWSQTRCLGFFLWKHRIETG